MFLYRFDNAPELVEGWTHRQAADQRLARAHPAARRHGAVRHGRRSGAHGAAGPQPQEGRRDHLGRQRHEQPQRRLLGQAADSRRPRFWCTRSASMGRPNRCWSAISIRRARRRAAPRFRCRFRCRAAGAHRRPRRSRRRGRRDNNPRWRSPSRRPRERRGAARHHRRQRRHEPRSSATRAISIRRRPASPTS